MQLKKFLICFLLYVTAANASGVRPDVAPEKESFILTYAPLAITEMHRSGIPASIKLAQAILETNWGKGQLALYGRNYFGIKCKNEWVGDAIYLKDDDYNDQGELIESCFRSYTSIEASFIDHTDFLMRTPRYAELFKNQPNDYSAWANGLQSKKYATLKTYGSKLIEIIRRYHLNIFDYVPLDQLDQYMSYWTTAAFIENHVAITPPVAPPFATEEEGPEAVTLPHAFILLPPSYYDVLKTEREAPPFLIEGEEE